jgi:hypothetical protein
MSVAVSRRLEKTTFGGLTSSLLAVSTTSLPVKATFDVVASLPDESRLPAERLRPGRHVRRLAARRRALLRNLVVSRDELGVEPDDHVEEEIAEGRQPHAA